MSGFSPLIRKVKNGTMVTFQSTGEDMSLTWQSSTRKFRFSRFALLNIPPIATQTNNANNIVAQAIEGHFVNGLSSATPPPEGDRVDLSQSLQNYLLNMETLLIRNSAYDPTLKQTAAERLFFKWLKEIGALRFRTAASTEVASTVTDPRFVEEDDNDSSSSGDIYHRVVKYVGEIDMEGNHISNTNSYKEVYIYVPTQNGNTPVVLFKSLEDDNYYAGQTIRKSDNVNVEYIEGRSAADQPTAAGLDVTAYYDMDVPLGTLTYLVNGNPSDPIWFDSLAPNGPNSYFTDPAFNDPASDLIVRTDPSNSNTVTYKRSRLDGISLDWDSAEYRDFELDNTLTAFNQYNASNLSDSFEFNAILIYYDIYDPNVTGDIATNLYGVLFLNDLEVVSAGGARFKPFSKIKPNTITRDQGNGFGIKLNFKFDTAADNVTSEVEISVNDYNTFSMQLFSETMQRIGLANTNFEAVLAQNLSLVGRLTSLESLVLNDANRNEILAQINAINQQLVGVTPNQALLDLINAVSERVNEILQGSTNVNLSFTLDLRAFDGLRLELVSNTLNFRNTRQRYMSSVEFNVNVTPNQQTAVYNVLELGTHDTLCYHRNGGQQKIAQGNISLFINDTNNWKLHQAMDIIFVDEVDMMNYGFAIYTDATNQFALSGNYQKLVGVIPQVTTTKPIITIICIDEENYEFIVTIK